MKKVMQDDLVIGRFYCDSARLNGWNAVVMQFVGNQKGTLVFKYISGVNEYIDNGDGLIRLGYYTKEPNWYWELTEEMQKYYSNQPITTT
jgi:hypothetical protein